jgi:hypothetical protein
MKHRLNLMNLSREEELAKREMRNIFIGAAGGGGGGDVCDSDCSCACACRYANSNGSSTMENGRANAAGGLSSPGVSYWSADEIQDLLAPWV